MPPTVTWVVLTGLDHALLGALRLASSRGKQALARSLAGHRYLVTDKDRALLASLGERRDAALVDERSWLRLRLRCAPRTAASEAADWLLGLPPLEREDFLLELVELEDEEWISHARLLLAAASPDYAQTWLRGAPEAAYDGESSLSDALGGSALAAAEPLYFGPRQVAAMSAALEDFPVVKQPRGDGMLLARHYLATFQPGMPVEVSFVRWLRGHLERLRAFYRFLASQGHGLRLRRFERVGAASLPGC